MPGDPRDYRLSLDSLEPDPKARAAPVRPSPPPVPPRPFLSVLFACCSVYVRVYRRANATGYIARCPKCGKSVRFSVSEEGTDARSFVVE